MTEAEANPPAETASESAATGPSAGASSAAQSLKKRKTVVGVVRSDKMQKTITVEVLRLEKHRKYHKYIRRRTTYKAHDERNEANVGDFVRIEETRPLSKDKRWRLVEIVRRAEATADIAAANPEQEGGAP